MRGNFWGFALLAGMSMALVARAVGGDCADVRLGEFYPDAPELDVSYVNPEFTPDGEYLVWFEPDAAPGPAGVLEGTVWHCAVDPATGALDPWHGRGFAAFRSTITKRANTGIDANGVYYVGANPDGWLQLVRPTGPTAGEVTPVSAAGPGPLRRGIFPSRLPDEAGGFVFWFRPDRGQTPSQAETVAVEYIWLGDPGTIIEVEQQVNPFPPLTWAPMDITVPRWFPGAPAFTYGYVDAADPGRTLRVRVADLDDPQAPQLADISSGDFDHTAAQPFVHAGQRCFVTNVETGTETRVYCEEAPGETYELVQSFTIPGSSLAVPCRAISYETFALGARTYATYVVSDCADSGSFFTDPGEIWLASVDGGPLVLQRLSRLTDATKNEPEALAALEHAWIYYNEYPAGADPLTVTYQLRRVPARLVGGDLDCDGDVDLADVARFQLCLGGADQTTPCEVADLDVDGAWTVEDFSLLAGVFGSPAPAGAERVR